MRVRLIRHATLAVEFASRRILVDPVLSAPEELPPVEGTPNQRPNPLVPLPVDPAELVQGLDGVLLTHLHTDHLDEAAVDALPAEIPVFCQPSDSESIADQGFSDVRPIDEAVEWDGLRLSRTEGRHGTGEIGEQMGPVAGWVLTSTGEPTLYVAGDTIWCPEVRSALDAHEPDVVVVNSGAARFTEGDPITMTAEDVVETAQAAPGARVVAAVHLEAINHCLLTRAELRNALLAADLGERGVVPEDGEELDLSALDFGRA